MLDKLATHRLTQLNTEIRLTLQRIESLRLAIAMMPLDIDKEPELGPFYYESVWQVYQQFEKLTPKLITLDEFTKWVLDAREGEDSNEAAK